MNAKVGELLLLLLLLLRRHVGSVGADAVGDVLAAAADGISPRRRRRRLLFLWLSSHGGWTQAGRVVHRRHLVLVVFLEENLQSREKETGAT